MSGVNFTLESAKRIIAAVKRVEGTPRELAGQRITAPPVGTSFWAALTGCDLTGIFWDWLAVVPVSNLPTQGNPWTLTPASMWAIREPYTAGFSNAREANAR